GLSAEENIKLKGGTEPDSNSAGHSGPLTEMIVLGNLAVRSGRTIELNPETGAILTSGIPADWVTRVYRSAWNGSVWGGSTGNERRPVSDKSRQPRPNDARQLT